MSYIRCTSNPEGLYIWHDVSGYIAFTVNNGNNSPVVIGNYLRSLHRSKRKYDPHWGSISLREWRGFCRKYRLHLDENSFGNVRSREVYMDENTGDIVEIDSADILTDPRALSPRILFSFRDLSSGLILGIPMWETTFHYFMGNATRK